MAERTSPRGALIWGALIGCLALSATPAEAAKRLQVGKLKTVKSTVPVAGVQGAGATATATCPPGRRAVSGGYSSAPIPNQLAPLTFKRVGGRSWTVFAAQTNNQAAPATLTAYVYCDPRLKKAPAATATGTIALATVGDATATCPGGRRAISGGWEIPTDAAFTGVGLAVSSTRTAANAWTAAAVSINGPSTTLHAYAYCARRQGRERIRTGPVTPVPTGSATALSGLCPKRRGARSGGFSLTGDYFLMQEMRRAGRRWTVTARNLDPTPFELTTSAYCT